MVSPREVCFLLGQGDTVLWSDASNSPVALPDSRERWEAIWTRRDRIVEIAHTHPLGGSAFSQEDETTMAALDSALGRTLVYSVVTPTAMLRRTWKKDGTTDAQLLDPLADSARTTTEDRLVAVEPWWTSLIRAASGILDAAKLSQQEE